MKQFFLTALCAAILWPNFSFAGERPVFTLSKTPCIEAANSEERTQKARKAFYALLNAMPEGKDLASVLPEQKIESIVSQDHIGIFYRSLADAMRAQACGFSPQADFDTAAAVIDAIANKSFKAKNPASVPQWLRPGFRAVLAGFDSDDTLFIETTNLGFIFHACEHDVNTYQSASPAPNEKCPRMLNHSVFIPVDEMIEQTVGIKHDILIGLKALTEVSVVVTANLSLAWLSPIAQAVVNLISPNPLDVMERDREVGDSTNAILTLGSASAHPEGEIITRIVPHKYQDLKAAMIDMTGEVFKEEYRDLKKLTKHPHDPNLQMLPAVLMERDFYTRVQEMNQKPQGQN